MKPGDAFVIADPRKSLDTHVWFVLSDPSQNPDKVLIVNFTTWSERKEGVCIVHPREHPSIHHKSCVNYGDAKAVHLEQLRTLEKNGSIQRRVSLSTELLDRAYAGAALSKRMSLEHAEILIDQGLIDQGLLD